MTTADANDAVLDSWALSLHDKQPRTRRLYLDEARRFATWLAEHHRPQGQPGDLLAVGRRDAEAWITDLRAAGLAGATIRSRWIAMRNFYGWALDEDEIDESPLAKVTVSKPNPPPVPTLSADQLRALFKACEGRDFNDRRDMALIRLMAATGIRLAEVVDLELADLDLPNRVVLIRHGKGDRARMVRFDPETAQALDRYKRARGRHRHAGLPNLWLALRGPLSRKGVPTLIDKRAKRAGIGHVHPHQLRHTFADRFLAAGGTEGDLQRLGGWESAEIMRRYGSARADDRALAAYDVVNPLDGL